MNAHRHSPTANAIQRFRIAIPPGIFNIGVAAPPGQRREVALVGARTPSGTFEITEALPATLPHSEVVAPGRVTRSRSVRRRRRYRFSILACGLSILAVTLGGYELTTRWSHSGGDAIAQPRPPASITAPIRIAVLPFQNLSDDKQFAYTLAGLQSEILSDLSKVSGLKVISRTSMMQYENGSGQNLREIARQVGAQYLVEGTVQRVEGRIRVSAQLIDGGTDMHLWGEHYDRELADVFAIENDVAEQIVAQLKGKLSPAEKQAIEAPPIGYVGQNNGRP